MRIVTPGYLEAMGIRLTSGRDFSWQDASNTEQVVIINETAARRHWPGESPLGHLARGMGKNPARVIGVVSDVRVSSLETSPGSEMYLLATQATPEGSELVVRSKLPPDVLTPTVMSALRRLNSAQPVATFRPVQTLVDHAVSPRRFFVLLVSIFAALGLLLAALGIYGVISYSVTRQTQEIGIRIALGATAGRVLIGVLSGTLRLAMIGIILGGIVSMGVARWIGSLLFHTETADPATFLLMMLLLTAVACAAGFFPRAARLQHRTNDRPPERLRSTGFRH